MTPRERFTGVPRWVRLVLFAGFLVGSGLSHSMAADAPVSDVLLNALGGELQRSISLRLGEFDPPYFIQYMIDDSVTHRLTAAYGALVSSNDSRSRVLHSQLRVGSYEFDNSNFAGRGGFGGFGGSRGIGASTELPTDNDDLALRHAVWSATDSLYKSSVATLAQKRAYLRERNVGDRPHDFTKAIAPTTELLEPATVNFDRATWEEYVRKISGKFASYPDIQDSDVSLTMNAETRYLVNSEGSRLRCGTTGMTLRVSAESQASDGERLSDSLNYFAWTPSQLPQVDTILADVEKLASRLASASQSQILEDYTGPVLIDGIAASQLFRQLLAQGLTAQAEPLGSTRRDGDDLQSRLGKRILPVTFHIYDDPRQSEFQGTFLAGHYRFDDEGLAPERVEIVVDGKLEGMVTSRTPTKPFAKSNGHGRRGSGASASASIGCLYVEASKGLSAEELKQELIDAADAEGLNYGLRITSLRNRLGGSLGALASALGRRGGGPPTSISRVGDPISIYKVYVADGREEPVRGCEFVALDIRSLRRIIAAGKESTVHNSVGGITPPSSVVAPAILFEELELSRIKQESEKKPILTAPHARK